MKFLERTLTNFVDAMEGALGASELAQSDGLLQRLDPRTKLVGVLALVVAAATAHRLWVIGGLLLGAVLLALASHVSFASLSRRVWLPVLVFTGIIALPAPFVIPGHAVWHLPGLAWAVTAPGLRSAGFLVTRVETAATFSVLLILSTPWSHVLKALRVFRVPVILVVILGMTYRYIFLLFESAHAMLESHRARIVGDLPGAERRRLAAASVGVLTSKTFDLSADVYSAMLARGFRGEVHVLDDFRTAPLDWLMLGIFLALAAGAVYWGH